MLTHIIFGLVLFTHTVLRGSLFLFLFQICEKYFSFPGTVNMVALPNFFYFLFFKQFWDQGPSSAINKHVAYYYLKNYTNTLSIVSCFRNLAQYNMVM